MSLMKPLVLKDWTVAELTYWPELTVHLHDLRLNPEESRLLSEWLSLAAKEIEWVKDHGGTAS